VPKAEMFWGGTTPILLHNSDSRGIDTIRNQVKDFAKMMAIQADAPKIILLDEADALTKEAQQALRRTMESYASSCRFILSCNYPSKIIDPIKSRCAIFKFKQLDENAIKEIINNVAAKENLEIENNIINSLSSQCNGDVRQLQNILQSCSAVAKKIDRDAISNFLTPTESNETKEMLNITLTKGFIEARKKLVDLIYDHGLSGVDIVKQIQKEIMNLNINDERKLGIIEKCGEIEFRLVEGSDDLIQLEALLAFISKK
jgi:replication factor C small subunit